MYSGYLNANSSLHLFYWLVESSSPSDKLLIWFNGGPGCSSLDGFFYENGPFMFDKNSGRLEKNKWSWNNLANVLYIESPVGTGFSYSEAGFDHTIDDNQVAEVNFLALRDFYRKFPRYYSMDLYITGESYAGVYVPTLAREIANKDTDLSTRLKGLYVGNGILHKKLNTDALMEYGFYHGFVGTQLWGDIQRTCCEGREKCYYDAYLNNECEDHISEFKHAIYNEGLNIYNFADDCVVHDLEALTNTNSRFYEYLSNEGGSQRSKMQPTCFNATFLAKYLDRADVRQAIHARIGDQWNLCSGKVFYAYSRMYDDLSEIIRGLHNELPDLKILLYFGDFDLVCNFLGGERFVDQLGIDLTIARRKWEINKQGSMQIAGYYKQFGNLSFATIKAAGHMVPADKPQEIYELVDRVMNDRPI